MMRVSYFCFGLAALAGMIGMALGLYMGIAEDHSLSPAHAHLNLVGWVTMMLYGLYHRSAPQGDAVLRWVQAGLGGAGFPAFSGGLAAYLQSDSTLAFVTLTTGVCCSMAAMGLFAIILLRDGRRLRLAQTPGHAPAAALA